MKDKLLYNTTLSVMGYGLGTVTTVLALEYANFGDYDGCMLIPIGLIVAGILTIMLTSYLDKKDKKNIEKEKNTPH